MRTEVVFKDGLKMILNGKDSHKELDEGFIRGLKTVTVDRGTEIVTIVLDNVLFYRLRRN